MNETQAQQHRQSSPNSNISRYIEWLIRYETNTSGQREHIRVVPLVDVAAAEWSSGVAEKFERDELWMTFSATICRQQQQHVRNCKTVQIKNNISFISDFDIKNDKWFIIRS